jgi:hypothetical protein
VDRAKADLPTILGVVLDKNEHGLYKIGTKDGVVDMPDHEITLRSAARKAAIGTGQGFVRCASTENCTSKRCLCRKKGNLATLNAMAACLVAITENRCTVLSQIMVVIIFTQYLVLTISDLSQNCFQPVSTGIN